MRRKRSPNGEPERFLRSLVGHSGLQCIPWPFCVDHEGYGIAIVSGRQKKASRHICILAHGAPPFARAEAAHRCGNRACVNPRHIRWRTAIENSKDKFNHGTVLRGEQIARAALSATDVIAIRESEQSGYALAKRYSVSTTCIYSIRHRRTWRHVE